MGLLIVIWMTAAAAFTLGWIAHSSIVRSRLSTFSETQAAGETVELIDLTTGTPTSRISPRR